MIFWKHKKTAAIILALVIALQHLCAAPAPAFEFCAPDVSAMREWSASDWLGILAHFSAFTGLSYWIGSAVYEAYDAVSELDGLWDFLSMLLRLGLIPHWYYELAPEPPGAFSI